MAVSPVLARQRLLSLATRCARDFMPPLRLAALLDVRQHPDSLVADVRRRLQKPRMTVDRCLQDLHALSLLELHEYEVTADKTVWRYSLAAGLDDRALALMDRAQKCHYTGSFER